MPSIGSLFSGIGGLELGLEWAGLGPVKWQVEIDDYATKVLEKHWPNVKRYRDIYEIDWSEVEPVDLICGGFPCQPVSVAGSRKGDSDERWLWPEFLRAIREVRPRYALVENVPGLLSADGGRLARGVFGGLAEIGYDAEWDIISAEDVGAPHLRRRIFIVAYNDSGRCNGQKISIFTGSPRSSSIVSFRSRGWDAEPDVGRVANGVPSRVDRLKCLGNAVVPQVAEYIGRRIRAYEEARLDV